MLERYEKLRINCDTYRNIKFFLNSTVELKLYIRVRSSSGKTLLKLTEKYFPSEVSQIPEEKYGVTLCLYLPKGKET